MRQTLQRVFALKFRAPSLLVKKISLGIGLFFAVVEIMSWFINGSVGGWVQALTPALYLTWGVLIYRGKSYAVPFFALCFTLWFISDSSRQTPFALYALFICIIHSSAAQNIFNLLVLTLIAVDDYRLNSPDMLSYIPLMFCIFLILPLAVRLHWEGRLRSETALATYRERVAEANRELARELHDTVARHISVINLNAHSALQQAEMTGKDAALTAITTSSDRALTDVRALIQTARDDQSLSGAPQLPAANVPPLGDALHFELENLRSKGLMVKADIDYSSSDVPEGLRPTVYKIIKELAFNASKYAQPGTEIDLQVSPNLTGITIRTSNLVKTGTPQKKANPGEPGTGFGLVGIEERIRRLGGTMSYGAVADRWDMTIHLPIPL